MKKILLFLALLSYLNSLSQHKKIIYADENYNIIPFLKYQKKLSSKLFDIATIENDTAIFKKLRYAEFYGSLKPKMNSQLTKLFTKRFNIDSTKTLLIHYIDSVPDIKKMPKESGIKFIDTLNMEKIFFTKTELKSSKNNLKYKKKYHHILSVKDYIKNIKHKKNRYNKRKLELIHLYKKNRGFPEKKLKSLKYFEDDNHLIGKIFSDELKMYNVILIHPNGEFYVSNLRNHSYNKENKLSKKSFYDKQRKKWLKNLMKL